MNLLILSGRLTKNFELSKGVAKSSIAVDVFKDKTMFVDITAFKANAEYCAKYLRKGEMVVVEGELNIYKKDDKTFVSCIVRSIQGGGKKKDDVEDDVKLVPSGVEMGLPTGDKDVADDPISIEDDDLPF